MTLELERLFLLTEEKFGIKAGEDELEKFRQYLVQNCGGNYENAFHSGEAAGFLTINETYFFREQNHFTFLQKLLPSFQDKIRICSAATSTGCEAYSIAMLIEFYKRTNKALSYHIDAFDINPHVIETAEKGMYGKNSFREDGSIFHSMADMYLEKSGDTYIVDPSLKNNIRFFVHNILDPLPAVGLYDLVFFRNAFIYFSPRSRLKILSNLAASLKENGKLIMGVAETAGVNHPSFTRMNVNETVHDDVFYFQKSVPAKEDAPPVKAPVRESPEASPQTPVYIDPAGVGDIIRNEKEAAELAETIRKALAYTEHRGFSGNELAAALLFLLYRGDFSSAEELLKHIEARDDSAFTVFLRGEYAYLQDMFTEAEFQYKVALGKDDAFWPALYRLGSLASTGVIRKYRAQQALESLKRGMNLQYEVFIGGFSPDYYRGALVKQTQNAG